MCVTALGSQQFSDDTLLGPSLAFGNGWPRRLWLQQSLIALLPKVFKNWFLSFPPRCPVMSWCVTQPKSASRRGCCGRQQMTLRTATVITATRLETAASKYREPHSEKTPTGVPFLLQLPLRQKFCPPFALLSPCPSCLHLSPEGSYGQAAQCCFFKFAARKFDTLHKIFYSSHAHPLHRTSHAILKCCVVGFSAFWGRGDEVQARCSEYVLDIFSI